MAMPPPNGYMQLQPSGPAPFDPFHPWGTGGDGGSMFGGWGGAANAIGNGIADLNKPKIPQSPNWNQMQGMMGQQAAQLDPVQQAQARAMQLAQAQQLQRIASGQQQGAGELAAQRQVQNALAAQQAQARMVRGGGNAGLGLLAGARNAGAVGLSGAGMGQQAALRDQQMAQGQLSGALGGMRGQDIGFAGQNAGYQNQRYGENLNALSADSGQRLGATQPGLLGGMLNAAGQIGAGYATHSDENLKTDITDARDDIQSLLDNLHAKTYRYKDEAKHGAGKRAGIMAQDLERSKAGRALVIEAPDGKAFDNSKAISALLASAAQINERLRKVEGK